MVFPTKNARDDAEADRKPNTFFPLGKNVLVSFASPKRLVPIIRSSKLGAAACRLEPRAGCPA